MRERDARNAGHHHAAEPGRVGIGPRFEVYGALCRFAVLGQLDCEHIVGGCSKREDQGIERRVGVRPELPGGRRIAQCVRPLEEEPDSPILDVQPRPHPVSVGR